MAVSEPGGRLSQADVADVEAATDSLSGLKALRPLAEPAAIQSSGVLEKDEGAIRPLAKESIQLAPGGKTAQLAAAGAGVTAGAAAFGSQETRGGTVIPTTNGASDLAITLRITCSSPVVRLAPRSLNPLDLPELEVDRPRAAIIFSRPAKAPPQTNRILAVSP